jgi:acyl-CoA synthetase (AMP-forming)/AMP-acid ligase II
VVEVDGQPTVTEVDAIRAGIIAAVAREHRLSLHGVFVTARRAVPRTSSGKVQRRACRAALVDGTLDLLGGTERPRASAPTPTK